MMDNNTYDFRFNEDEIKMIRLALMLETERRKEVHSFKTEDYDRLASYFNGFLEDIRRDKEQEIIGHLLE